MIFSLNQYQPLGLLLLLLHTCLKGKYIMEVYSLMSLGNWKPVLSPTMLTTVLFTSWHKIIEYLIFKEEKEKQISFEGKRNFIACFLPHKEGREKAVASYYSIGIINDFYSVKICPYKNMFYYFHVETIQIWIHKNIDLFLEIEYQQFLFQ